MHTPTPATPAARAQRSEPFWKVKERQSSAQLGAAPSAATAAPAAAAPSPPPAPANQQAPTHQPGPAPSQAAPAASAAPTAPESPRAGKLDMARFSMFTQPGRSDAPSAVRTRAASSAIASSGAASGARPRHASCGSFPLPPSS
eukprot:4709224-Prymnesium_polylepis.2